VSSFGTAVDTLRFAHWTGDDAAGIAAHFNAFDYTVDGTTLLLTMADGLNPTPVPAGHYLTCRWHYDGYWQPQETADATFYAARYSTAMADNAAAIADLTARVEALEAP
jgi:hypothetical protein